MRQSVVNLSRRGNQAVRLHRRGKLGMVLGVERLDEMMNLDEKIKLNRLVWILLGSLVKCLVLCCIIYSIQYSIVILREVFCFFKIIIFISKIFKVL